MDTLIVAAPCRNVDELREFRDYVMESLGCGVLVLPDTCTYTCMQSTRWTDTGNYIVRPACRTEIDKPDIEPEPEPPEPKFNGKGAAEKRAAFERLKRYWKHKGLGSLDDVAALAGGGDSCIPQRSTGGPDATDTGDLEAYCISPGCTGGAG